MKLMRSRFRLITLLLVCAFLLTLSLCAGKVLKEAGISFSSLSLPSISGVVSSPDPASPPDGSVAVPSASVPPDALPDESVIPGTDNSPDPLYNNYEVFGL